MNYRKFVPIAIIFTLFAFLSACAGIGAFSFSEESQPITVEASPLPGSGIDILDGLRIPMEVDLEQQLKEQEASGARSVTLTELYFETTEETTQDNFDFLDEITIEISSRQSGSDLPRETLAWQLDVPRGESKFHLEVDDDLDLKPYAEEGLRLSTSASGSAPDEDVVFKVYAKFRVNVI